MHIEALGIAPGTSAHLNALEGHYDGKSDIRRRIHHRPPVGPFPERTRRGDTPEHRDAGGTPFINSTKYNHRPDCPNCRKNTAREFRIAVAKVFATNKIIELSNIGRRWQIDAFQSVYIRPTFGYNREVDATPKPCPICPIAGQSASIGIANWNHSHPTSTPRVPRRSTEPTGLIYGYIGWYEINSCAMGSTRDHQFAP